VLNVIRQLRQFFGLYRVSQVTAAKLNDYRDYRLGQGAARGTINAELSGG
jgi:hypothetical protein